MVMPTTHDRLALVEAGRTWRKGMQAYIVLERALDREHVSKSLLDGIDEYREVYGHFGDIHNQRIWSQPGDPRWVDILFSAMQVYVNLFLVLACLCPEHVGVCASFCRFRYA